MDVAIELIAERGVRNFSLAEASRRLGVTVAAPYRHFADRDDLIAAVAVRAVHAFARALTAEVDETQPAGQRMAAMTRGYVRFAAGQRPLFNTVYGSGLDKNRYPELKAAFESVEQAFGACVRDICGSLTPRAPTRWRQRWKRRPTATRCCSWAGTSVREPTRCARRQTRRPGPRSP